MCYIEGGKPEGSEKIEKGSRNQTPPEAEAKVELAYPLYFAKSKSKWGKGGVAFISHEKSKSVRTIGRMYLITQEQFEDVVAQENNEEHFTIDVQEVMKHGYQDINSSWYGRILYLGNKDGAPMLTFTNPLPMESEAFTVPPSSYLKIITRGLKELDIKMEDILHYFNQCNGIKGHFTNEELHKYIVNGERQ
ncbi:hypothetical protein [Bacillus sp. FJAT-49736]|uniref:hypothetical protein n=1 Tax=Bacillus sp. FJAT-49736 TaxID=2833582 RepID=UPI00201623F1|nr:hypothetical protein [Bacillus sp. FJAT-49736]